MTRYIILLGYLMSLNPIMIHAQLTQWVVEGSVQLSPPSQSSMLPDPGSVQWTSGDFEVWTGLQWISLTGGQAICVDGESISNPSREYGRVVELSQDLAFVGSPTQTLLEEGKVFVYIYNGNWTVADTLTAPDGYPGNDFGSSLAAFQNYIVVGASVDNNRTGAIYIFKQNGSQWDYLTKIIAPDATEGEGFGIAVAMDDQFILVGQIGDNNLSGSVYVFEKDGLDNWSFLEKWEEGSYLYGGEINLDNEYAIVGAYGDFGNTGAAFVYHWNNVIWTLDTALTPPDLVFFDNFGRNIGFDYPNLAVTAPGRDSLYLYSYDGNEWILKQHFDVSNKNIGQVDLEGLHMIVGYNNFSNALGEADLYFQNNNAWTFRKTLRSGTQQFDWFGNSVSTFNGQYLVGAPNASNPGQGAVYFFEN